MADRDVHASTISLGVYQGTQLCDLHIMNLKSCSVSRPLCVKTACVYEEKVSSQFHGITRSAQPMATTISEVVMLG